MTSIKNLTPHPVIIRDNEGNALVTIPPTGEMARVAEVNTPDTPIMIDGVEVTVGRKAFTGTVQGLPAQPDGETTFVVPLLTAVAAKATGRSTTDLLVPGIPTRDANGTVNGCTSLARLV